MKYTASLFFGQKIPGGKFPQTVQILTRESRQILDRIRAYFTGYNETLLKENPMKKFTTFVIDWVTTNDSTKIATGIAVFSAASYATMWWMAKKMESYESEINKTIREFNEKYASK